jgi:uncharacterized protein YecE (DUF72 family)
MLPGNNIEYAYHCGGPVPMLRSMINRHGIFRSGTSGLVLSEPNKKHFPAEFKEKPRLSYYASKFNSIEINSSFYKIPRCQTYVNWSLQVPGDFQFSIKLWKGITHNKVFGFEMRDVEAFFSALDCLGKKNGCLLIQFPATTPMDMDNLRDILEQVKQIDPHGFWRLAIEFRHNRWYEKRVVKMIEEYEASLVLHDMPNSFIDKLQDKPSFVYLRFHGEKGDYRGTYSKDYLDAKAKEIRKWLSQGLDVYAYFNNTIGGAAVNLETLNVLVNSPLITT